MELVLISYSLLMLKLFTTIASKRRLFKITNMHVALWRVDYPRGIASWKRLPQLYIFLFADSYKYKRKPIFNQIQIGKYIKV